MRGKTGWKARRERNNTGILPARVRATGKKSSLADGRMVFRHGVVEFVETRRGSGRFVKQIRRGW